jgi:hypothetical protein
LNDKPRHYALTTSPFNVQILVGLSNPSGAPFTTGKSAPKYCAARSRVFARDILDMLWIDEQRRKAALFKFANSFQCNA